MARRSRNAACPQGEDTREDLLKVFKLFDDDKTGTISFKNLKRVAKEEKIFSLTKLTVDLIRILLKNPVEYIYIVDQMA